MEDPVVVGGRPLTRWPDVHVLYVDTAPTVPDPPDRGRNRRDAHRRPHIHSVPCQDTNTFIYL